MAFVAQIPISSQRMCKAKPRNTTIIIIILIIFILIIIIIIIRIIFIVVVVNKSKRNAYVFETKQIGLRIFWVHIENRRGLQDPNDKKEIQRNTKTQPTTDESLPKSKADSLIPQRI